MTTPMHEFIGAQYRAAEYRHAHYTDMLGQIMFLSGLITGDRERIMPATQNTVLVDLGCADNAPITRMILENSPFTVHAVEPSAVYCATLCQELAPYVANGRLQVYQTDTLSYLRGLTPDADTAYLATSSFAHDHFPPDQLPDIYNQMHDLEMPYIAGMECLPEDQDYLTGLINWHMYVIADAALRGDDVVMQLEQQALESGLRTRYQEHGSNDTIVPLLQQWINSIALNTVVGSMATVGAEQAIATWEQRTQSLNRLRDALQATQGGGLKDGGSGGDYKVPLSEVLAGMPGYTFFTPLSPYTMPESGQYMWNSPTPKTGGCVAVVGMIPDSMPELQAAMQQKMAMLQH